ncbi:hypothetical protein AZE42_00400, partial [Rhizopogon vesiculosus]
VESESGILSGPDDIQPAEEKSTLNTGNRACLWTTTKHTIKMLTLVISMNICLSSAS